HLRGPVVEQSPRPTRPVRADRHRLASRALRSRRSVGRRLLDPDHDSRYRQFGTAAALRAPRRHGRLPGGALGARNLSEENGMSTITKDESAVREGKTYGYQRAPEAISGGASIAERTNQVVTAFEDFLDALARSGGGDGSAKRADGAGDQTQPAAGAPSTGAGRVDGGAARGPGERPTGEAAGKGAKQEALEMSIYSQREAYRMDRAREAARKAHRRESAAALNGSTLATMPVAALPRNKHQRSEERRVGKEGRRGAARR